jgi:hypothetical protein
VINQIFDGKYWEKELIETLNHVKENILEHRKANFIGAILQHHTLMSTKYMSKWIEEKNK